MFLLKSEFEEHLRRINEKLSKVSTGGSCPPHNHVRSNITDFWSSPFWNNIPDKPSTYPPSSHASSHNYDGADPLTNLKVSGSIGNQYVMPQNVVNPPNYFYSLTNSSGHDNGLNVYTFTAHRRGSIAGGAFHAIGVHTLDESSAVLDEYKGSLCIFAINQVGIQKPVSGTSKPDCWGLHSTVEFIDTFGGGSGGGTVQPRMIVGISSYIDVKSFNWETPPNGAIRLFDGYYIKQTGGKCATELLYLGTTFSPGDVAEKGIFIQGMSSHSSWQAFKPAHIVIEGLDSNNYIHTLRMGMFTNTSSPYAAITYDVGGTEKPIFINGMIMDIDYPERRLKIKYGSFTTGSFGSGTWTQDTSRSCGTIIAGGIVKIWPNTHWDFRLRGFLVVNYSNQIRIAIDVENYGSNQTYDVAWFAIYYD